MGFWSTLGGIVGTAAGFIPGIGPIAKGVIQAASGIGGMVGDKLTSGGTNNVGGGLSVDAGKPYTSPAVQQGLDTLDSSKGYLQGVMGGSQEQTQGLLGPEVSTVLGQYDQAAKTAAELGPRGGGRTAILAEAPFKKVAAYGQALAGAKKTALEQLPKIGEAEANIGTQQEQLNNQFKLGQANVNVGQNRNILTGQQEQNKAYGDIGSGIGGILTRVILGNKGGGGSPSITDSNLTESQQRSFGF
jgi:hypothetical protein